MRTINTDVTYSGRQVASTEKAILWFTPGKAPSVGQAAWIPRVLVVCVSASEITAKRPVEWRDAVLCAAALDWLS